MIWFWMAAAALSGGAALLVILFARTEAAKVGGEDPALGVHRRHLLEIDELADRGLLNPQDRAAARAEAARRLLSSADRKAGKKETRGGRTSRRVSAMATVVAGGGALGLYLVYGAPGVPDQPYRSRLAEWLRADPATLDAPKMAAVLQTIATKRPTDPQVFGFLGRADAAAGDPFGAQKAFERAVRLAPGKADYQVLLGESLLDGTDGKPSEEAEAAFRRALLIDPQNLTALYSLGRLEIASGDRAEGLERWRKILGLLPASDARRAAFASDVERVAGGGPLDAPPAAWRPRPCGRWRRGRRCVYSRDGRQPCR